MKKKSTIPPKRTGRPTKYTDALADEICRRIAEGEMLMQIVRDEHMPERKTVYNWMNEHDDFLHNYARACEMSADALVEKGLEILDGSSPDCAQMDKIEPNTVNGWPGREMPVTGNGRQWNSPGPMGGLWR